MLWKNNFYLYVYSLLWLRSLRKCCDFKNFLRVSPLAATLCSWNLVNMATDILCTTSGHYDLTISRKFPLTLSQQETFSVILKLTTLVSASMFNVYVRWLHRLIITFFFLLWYHCFLGGANVSFVIFQSKAGSFYLPFSFHCVNINAYIGMTSEVCVV